jgi:isopentenyl-diphosphate Delta-isomerase
MIEDRKKDHIRICATENVESGNPGFDGIRLRHRACPEISLGDVDTSCVFLGKKMDYPLIIEAITGGTSYSKKVNRDLAKTAQKYNVGFGVGSQRAAIEDPSLEETYAVRDAAPDILLIGNLGAVQLNHGYGLRECRRAVEMIGADALALHLNSLQEAVQPEGDTDFRNLIKKINYVAAKIKTPLIVKEVGSGLDLQTAKRLKAHAYDAGGMGGTNWALVESHRNRGVMGEAGKTFLDWGTPTVECIRELSKTGKPLIGSGGIRSGLDAAKAIASGADIVGIALPAIRAYEAGGVRRLEKYLDKFIAELKISMFLTGSKKTSQLRKALN